MNNFSKKKWNINVPFTYNNPMYARKTRNNNLNNLSNSEKQFLANTNNLTVSERKEILRKRRKNLKNKRARQLMRSLNTYKSSEIVSYKEPNTINSSIEYKNNPMYTTTLKKRNNNLNNLSNGEKRFLEDRNSLTVNQRKQIIRKRRENIKIKRGRQLMRSLNTYRAS